MLARLPTCLHAFYLYLVTPITMFSLVRRTITKWRDKRLFSHKPVMADEIVQILKPEDGKVFIDMTFGGGGHTRHLLETNKSITVVAVDRDPVAYRRAQELSAKVAIKSERLNIKQTVIPVHGRFSRVMRDIHLSGIPYGSVHGVIFDLGASSIQYDDSSRGFAVSSDGPLDMRMDTTVESDITAEDVVNNMSQANLSIILKTLGEERRCKKISNAIVDAKTLLGRIRTTQELARIISSSSTAGVDSLGRYSHPATKTFQALRIFVNNELNELNYALEKIHEFLVPTKITDEVTETQDPMGLVAVLTFHSLEDRIVKRHFSGVDPDEPIVKCLSQHHRIRTNVLETKEMLEKLDVSDKWKPLFKHVIKPSDAEIAANPRSRSAKLRVAMRLA